MTYATVMWVPLVYAVVSFSANRTHYARWLVKDPTFISQSDKIMWHSEWERPFGGCQRTGNNGCVYSSGESYTYEYVDAYAPKEMWGGLACGLYHAPVKFQEHLYNCDQRTFIPLDVAEGGYFAHFMINVLPKLVLLPDTIRSRSLLYVPPTAGVSEDTLAVASMLNVTITTVVPSTCFKRVFWCCNTIGYHRTLGHAIQKLFLPAVLPALTNRVYMRRNSGNKNGRNVKNEAQLSNYFRSQGYTILDGSMSLDSVRPILQSTLVFVSAHGGACAKIYWMQPKTVFVELDTHKQRTSIYHLVARSLHIKYGFMHFPSSVVDTNDVERMIDLLLDK